MRSLLIACVAGLAAPAAAHAHHSRAPYDLTQEIVVEGRVVELDWKNPHIYMTIETAGPDGEPVLQEIEVLSVSEARALGLTPEALALGSSVVLSARPNRRSSPSRIRRI